MADLYRQPAPQKPPRKAPRRPRGRPRGEPSIVINVRLPISLLERLDHYLDREEQRSRETVNRAIVIRELLDAFLEEEGL